MSSRKIQSALISVYYKDGLAPIAQLLHQQGVTIYSTGGTQTFLQDLNIPVIPVEELTSYPSILGGRVKTLHPKVFGGILHRRDEAADLDQVKQYEIPSMDLVIVDLYPFEETVASGASEEDIIEKIDIGGISLIRAAAKNHKDVVIVSSREQYATLEQILREKNGETELADRKHFAAQAFDITSHYDTAIFNYFNQEETIPSLKISERQSQTLRYGENPHQRGWFHGDLNAMFDQLHGKELSYNNLLDVDAAVLLIEEFKGETAYAILKHNNACGIAVDPNPTQAYLKALASDPVSAFGGVIITTTEVDIATAEELNKLFFEVLIAPSFSQSAFELLTTKKNRILLKKKDVTLPKMQVRTVLNGIMRQDRDAKMETVPELRTVTDKVPTEAEKEELIFAAKICKHTKSNTIVLSRDKQLIASGVGQTSRVDALKQAIEKARSFGFDLQGAVMASDAFFPFADCVEIAHGAGITAVIQPGGSIRDQDSINFCNQNGMAMVTTGIRHFKH
ncbi:bifunctional phosphoribosylaminoimidazolecarboxamide formyltransferase/IMP cyclohydrolase [Cytophagaceae bacterium DM2B3-1]|uniref:Bifunctional purine biosynthesis protein PurH n=1 Tax=Xanthocytophaga flava TaxID=3048013 RepID=A0ABT7CPN5_9BACT|nr:bifunctional phosphoribosylaminoimidazolecarboxamide formyltransferase/IMP cyclohydrolase [Xanthocytophaga flavus]MDJ1468812.1 bifunctional phosphoribosylaminoimidazolecarboxamide formyltransferase/IMP cyclohydrolase [Xanthocytophaga flavus]MDJ1495672.1 bifunctional phosphoribosylaminoimidazolecarboxamide formyltransferase/IMP cyclohydrolase [Xanthocytophaga flavus]